MLILNREMITISKSLILGLSLLLVLNACGDSSGGSYVFDKARNGGSPRNSPNNRDQSHIDDLINKIPPVSYLQSFYTANRDDINISLGDVSQPRTRPNNSEDPAILSVEEFTSATNTYFIPELENNILKCGIYINRSLDENTQTHLLAHQLKKCEVEKEVYTALIGHENFNDNDVEEFYQIRASLTAEDPANPLISLVKDMYVYSLWEAYKVNQDLQEQNVPFNHRFGLNNIQDLVRTELSTIDIFAADLDNYNIPDSDTVTIQNLINNFLSSSSSDPRSEISQNQPPIVGLTGGGSAGQ